MKRKYADRLDWKRVLKKDYICRFFDDGDFKGHISLIHIHEVKEPLVRRIGGQQVCLVDNGYYWMQHFPIGSNYCVTTMLNENKEIVQWYFDISKYVGINERGIPFWDDLYLDLIVFPSGDFCIKDEDELEEAITNNQITEDEYNLANRVMKGLIKEIETMENIILKNTMKHFNHISRHLKDNINN